MASADRILPGRDDVVRAHERVREEAQQGRREAPALPHLAGQKEILEGVSIRRHFKRIYASEYHFNHSRPSQTFPKLLVTDTLKTQFLFRINKGLELVTESINEHMPEAERPIPFANMVYVGDGMTDVPSMALTKKSGGTRWRCSTRRARGSAPSA